MNYDAKVIADNLAILMLSQGLNNEKMARKLGIALATFYRKRTGALTWNMREALLLCSILNVSLDTLFLSKIVPNGTGFKEFKEFRQR